MEDYIYDGKCHILNKNCGYIIKKIESEKSILEFEMIEKDLLKKYANYLFDNEREKCLDIICQNISYENNEYYSIIYLPPWICSARSQWGSLFLKFKRLENDNLDKN